MWVGGVVQESWRVLVVYVSALVGAAVQQQQHMHTHMLSCSLAVPVDEGLAVMVWAVYLSAKMCS